MNEDNEDDDEEILDLVYGEVACDRSRNGNGNGLESKRVGESRRSESLSGEEDEYDSEHGHETDLGEEKFSIKKKIYPHALMEFMGVSGKDKAKKV